MDRNEKKMYNLCCIGKNKHLIEFIVAQKQFNKSGTNETRLTLVWSTQLDWRGAFAHIIPILRSITKNNENKDQ